MLVHQHKRFFFIPLIFHPVKSQISNDVCGVSNMFDYFIMLSISVFIQSHRWIVVRTLPDEYFRIIITLWRHVCTKMPLTHNRGGVTGFTKKFWKGLLGSVEFISVYQKSISVGIFPRLNGCPHRPANGVGNIALFEKHSILGKGIDMRGGAVLLEPGVVGSDCLVCMIIRENKKDIRFL